MPSNIITKAIKNNQTALTEIDSKQLISEAGIPVVETKLATSTSQAVSISKKMGFPVALKIVSPDIIHKSDCNGVQLGLRDAIQVDNAYEEIMAAAKKANPKAAIQGVSVQKMAMPGVEVIMGMSKDPQFGPAIMFGLGGVFVEVLNDVSFGIVPINEKDAAYMIRDVKGYPMLKGYRGQEPVNLSALEQMLLKLSEFVEKTPQIRELDLNPIIARADGVVAVDARILLEF
jgi:acyl-CoA synthetase (NDP forming)